MKKKDFKVDLKNDSPSTIKRKWVGALHSGLWFQGKGCLSQHYLMINGETITQNCCLGVLKNICGLKTRNKEFLTIGSSPPGELAPSADIQLVSYNDQNDLSEMNDNGNSFTEIAEYIKDKVNITKKGLII